MSNNVKVTGDLTIAGAATGTSLDVTGTVQGSQLISDVTTGTAPLQVSSTTRVSNLNVATAGLADVATDSYHADWSDTANALSAGIVQYASLGSEVLPSAYNLSTSLTEEKVEAIVTSNGTTVTLTVQATGGGNITCLFSGGPVTVDCVPALTLTLTPGTDAVPVENYVYILKSAPTVLTLGSDWPTTEHVSIGEFIIPTAARTQTYGTFMTHLYSDDTWHTGAQGGFVQKVGKWIRDQQASWISGVNLTPTLTALGPDTLTFATSVGSVKQLGPHVMPAFDSSAGGTVNTDTFFVANYSGANYTLGKDLFNFKFDSSGNAASNNSRICWVVWGVVSEVTGDCKTMVNVPRGFYANDADAIADVDRYTVYTIPNDYKGSGFLIAKLTYQYTTAGGGALTLVEQIDLRGTFPSLAAGGTGISGASVHLDNLSVVAVNTDISPDTDETWDLGTTLLKWDTIYGNITSESSTLGVATGTSLDVTGTVQGATVTADATTNQLVLGTTNTTTISSTAPSASRTVTLHDAGAASNFVLDTGGEMTITNAATSGYVLTATSVTASSWQVASGGGITQLATVSLSSSQIKALLASPVELVAAPGAGKYLVYIRAVSVFTYVAPVYANTSGTAYPALRYSGQTPIIAQLLPAAVVKGSADYAASDSKQGALEVYANTALVVNTTSAEFTAGNGTAVIYLYYYIAG